MEKKNDVSLGLCECLSLGIKTVLSEVYWTLLKALRQWEIKELKKRLDDSYLNLGKLIFRGTRNTKDKELYMKQIKFLNQEIEFLEKELDKIREQILRDRKNNWNI